MHPPDLHPLVVQPLVALPVVLHVCLVACNGEQVVVVPVYGLGAESSVATHAGGTHNHVRDVTDESLSGVTDNCNADNKTRDNSIPDNTCHGSNTPACTANPIPNSYRATPPELAQHMPLHIVTAGYSRSSTMPQLPNQEFSYEDLLVKDTAAWKAPSGSRTRVPWLEAKDN